MESDEILFIVNFEPHIGNKAALTFFGISMPETMKLAYKIDAFHHVFLEESLKFIPNSNFLIGWKETNSMANDEYNPTVTQFEN